MLPNTRVLLLALSFILRTPTRTQLGRELASWQGAVDIPHIATTYLYYVAFRRRPLLSRVIREVFYV